jgi:LPXTG-site transpeptidase (sortase) family protein
MQQRARMTTTADLIRNFNRGRNVPYLERGDLSMTWNSTTENSTTETGIAKTGVLAGLGCLGLFAAAALGFFVLRGGDSDEEVPPAVQATASPTAGPTAPPTNAPPPLSGSYRMIIDTLGVDAPVATYGLDERDIPIVPTGPDAAEVVAWYDFSAQPGTGGNSVFAGHVTWFGEAVFLKLETMKPGDSIRLLDEKGAEVEYRVTANQTLAPDDPEAVKTMYPTDKDMVTIITCGGTFFDTGDPIAGGDYTHRIVIKAELVNITRA